MARAAVSVVHALELTVPMELRPQFEGGAGAVRWGAVVREFVSWLKQSQGFRFGYVRSHPEGDEHPGLFHPHVNLVWVRDPALARKVDLVAFRAAWARVLGHAGEVDIFCQYFKLQERRGVVAFMHKLRYIERPFPGASWPGMRARWYGAIGGKVSPDSGERVCPKCGGPYSLVRLSPGAERECERAFQTGELPGFQTKRDGFSNEACSHVGGKHRTSLGSRPRAGRTVEGVGQ